MSTSDIPVTSIVLTLIDLATTTDREELERAINEADKDDLIDPETLRDALPQYEGWPGAPTLARMLDRATFTLTDSELERLFIPIALRAGLPRPLTGQWVNGYKVDFYWPDLKLVVETDGLRYHRTPTQQSADRRRDQAHAAAGLTTLRFTHAQVRFEPNYVEETLLAVAQRLEHAEREPRDKRDESGRGRRDGEGDRLGAKAVVERPSGRRGRERDEQPRRRERTGGRPRRG